jgi:hypothetical protein
MIAWLRSLFDQWRISRARIDPNAKCPACGNRGSVLKCIFVETQSKPNKSVMVERTCKTCGAQCYEPTIMKPEKWVSADLLRGTVPARQS